MGLAFEIYIVISVMHLTGNTQIQVSSVFCKMELLICHFIIYFKSIKMSFCNLRCMLLAKKFSTTNGDGYTYLNVYGIPYSGATFITFKVRACSDAYIALISPPPQKKDRHRTR